MALKGPGAPQLHDGTGLRVGIVHARWNKAIIDPLVAGTKAKLLASGVKEEDIVIQSSSAAGTGLSAGDLLMGGSTPDLAATGAAAGSSAPATKPFDALIAIGVLIKGETMHFEYIADSVSHGLMRVQLDTSVPVIFGLLTVLDEKQGLARAGVIEGSHNHGEDWGLAAVEMAVKRKNWAAGKV